MKNYTIFFYIFLLIFISKINAGPAALATCMGICLAPRHLACATGLLFGPIYTKCMALASVQCAGQCYLTLPAPTP